MSLKTNVLFVPPAARPTSVASHCTSRSPERQSSAGRTCSAGGVAGIPVGDGVADAARRHGWQSAGIPATLIAGPASGVGRAGAARGGDRSRKAAVPSEESSLVEAPGRFSGQNASIRRAECRADPERAASHPTLAEGTEARAGLRSSAAPGRGVERNIDRQFDGILVLRLRASRSGAGPTGARRGSARRRGCLAGRSGSRLFRAALRRL